MNVTHMVYMSTRSSYLELSALQIFNGQEYSRPEHAPPFTSGIGRCQRLYRTIYHD
jgi:hypothetical protein